ncbi:MAG: CoA transferase [Acidimicrobiia bacterium]|nr:CoA transferase [Acidimicrobiia bacterium]
MDKGQFFREARHDLTGPLDGVRVLEATTAWAGPMVGCMLADLGADVVRIDLPGSTGLGWPPKIPGTELSFADQTVNRNKRSVSLDLRAAEGQAAFLQLAAHADVVVENFRPGTLEGWGIGYAGCRAVKADIVYVSVSGWGQYGPWSERAGYDPAALAASGWMSLNGEADGSPTKAPTFLADDLAGLHGTIGALAALRHRDQTGEGQHVDVALLDSITYQSNGMLMLGALGAELPRWGSQVGATVPTNRYACQDGHLYLAIGLDSHWRKLATLARRPDLAEAPGWATNQERVDNRGAVDAFVAQWCHGQRVEDALEAVLAAGLVAARVATFTEAAQEPHVQERDMLQPTELVDGSIVPIVGPAAKFSRTPTRVRHPAPHPGTDTEQVLADLGWTGQARPGRPAPAAPLATEEAATAGQRP